MTDWIDWRDAVAYAANEWAPGELGQDYLRRASVALYHDFLREFLPHRADGYYVPSYDSEVNRCVNQYMSHIQEWALDWMIAHGYGQRGYRE